MARLRGAGAAGRCRPGRFGSSARRHGLADDGEPDRVLPARRRCSARRRHLVFGVQHPARRAADLRVRQRGDQGGHLRATVRRSRSRQRCAHRTHRLRRWRAPGTLSLTDLYAAASGDFFDFESTWRAVQPEDIVTLIYTSGTTGNPKGVEMTHANLLFEGYAIDEVLGIRFGDRVTSFLPSAHIADRMTGLYLQEMFGTQVTAVADARTIAAALPDVRPTVWGAVPRVWDLVRGPLVMKGYRKEPAKTAEAIDSDGWLHTGDVFDIDSDGYLRVVDRKKELIINAAGKNMSPANIENTILAACPMVGVMMAIGDGRTYNTALLVFDADSLGPYAAQRGLDASPAALAADPEVIARIAAGVAEGNAKLSRVEQIKRFRILPTLWEPGGDEITLTMKLKRRRIAAKYSAEIEELYASELRPQVYEPAAVPSTQPA
ncbi:fatty-acid--CoA ligase [Mycobacterium tuberculosis str. Beijing/DS6701]|nr:fatty-acid--CoA ligase [Mycobacterium tuberculosis str. Beijing/DS6701]